jgi:hypothetical protein
MKPLPTKFRSAGYDFQVVERNDKYALLSKTKGGMPALWEVVEVQKHEDYTIAGNLIPAHEAMPGNELWGKAGWSPANEELARKRFKLLMTQNQDAVSE